MELPSSARSSGSSIGLMAHAMDRTPGAARRAPIDLNLVVADPDPLARAFLVEALAESRLSVAAGAETLSEAEDAACRHSSRLIVLAATFPGLTGTEEAIRRVRKSSPTVAVVITQLPGADLDPLGAFQAGAAGYVVKDSDMASWFPPMVRRFEKEGITPLSAGISEKVIEELQDMRPVRTPEAASLSERELDVLGLVGRGLTNEQIAQALNLGTATVKTHIHNMFRKLKVGNRVLLALYARQRRREG